MGNIFRGSDDLFLAVLRFLGDLPSPFRLFSYAFSLILESFARRRFLLGLRLHVKVVIRHSPQLLDHKAYEHKKSFISRLVPTRKLF